MLLSKRLKKIVSLIPTSSEFIADIGSDHGHVCLELLKNRQHIKIFASDNKKGPYERLKKNLSKYENVIISLSDGLNELPSSVDTVIITGMGGETIKEIILKKKDSLNNIQYFLLSPHNDYKCVRKLLNELNYKIIEETFIEDGKKYYPIILYKKGNEKLSDLELKYGPLILKKKENAFVSFIDEKIKEKESLLKSKKLSQERINELIQDIKELNSL